LGSRKTETKTSNNLLRVGTGIILILMALVTFAIIQLNISRALQLGFLAQVAFAEQKYNTAGLYAFQSNQIHENDAANSVLGKLPYEDFPFKD
jgi:ABC-type enterobactin transport system permease subunit